MRIFNKIETKKEQYDSLMELFKSLDTPGRVSFRIFDDKGEAQKYTPGEYANIVINRSGEDRDDSTDYAVFNIATGLDTMNQSNAQALIDYVRNSDFHNKGIVVKDDGREICIPVKVLLDNWGIPSERIFRSDIGSPLLSMIQTACSSIPIDSNNFILRVNIEAAEERNKHINTISLKGKKINSRYIYEAYQAELVILLRSYSMTLEEYNHLLSEMSIIIPVGDTEIEEIEETGVLNNSSSVYVNVTLSQGYEFTVSRDVIRMAFESYESDIDRFG